ncbi:MAG: flippase-like domain-containing protein [Paludibacteraceae bacterium]|nr:flippase-like domain-containing protein [Paludibacteraceae bacterium]
MKKHLVKIIKLFVTISIFAFLFYKFGFKVNDVFNSIVMPWLLLVGIFLRLVVMQGIAMNRWQLFLRCSGINESIWTLTKISFISSFVGVVLPSSQGGDVMRMYFIEKRHRCSDSTQMTSSSTVLIERMIGFVILALFGLVCTIVVPDFPNKHRVLLIISLINFGLWSAIFILTNRWCYEKISAKLLYVKHFKNVCTFIEKTHYSLVNFPYRQVILPSAILIGSYQFVTVVILYLVFVAFGINLPIYQHMAFYPIIVILSIVPISISGLGIREGFFVYFYSLVGVEPQIAVGISLVNYAIDVLSGVFVGGILYGLKAVGFIKV